MHKTEKLVVERDGIVEGLTESIVSHGITKLVMGAAASKNYSRYDLHQKFIALYFRTLT